MRCICFLISESFAHSFQTVMWQLYFSLTKTPCFLIQFSLHPHHMDLMDHNESSFVIVKIEVFQ